MKKFLKAAAVALSVCVGFAFPAAAQEACPTNALGIQGGLQCYCPANPVGGSVWGSGPYTSDSNICRAALHSGAISSGGGVVSVTMMGGLASYPGSTSNGISTSSWGSYNSSFSLTGMVAQMPSCGTMPGGSEVHECSCPDGATSGSVWGSGPYTNDSSICAAAIHSGVISIAGGPVRVLAAPGLQSYRGSAWNGITTSNYGAWSGSIIFDRN